MNPTKETAKYAANIVREWLENISFMDTGEQDLERKVIGDIMTMKIQESNPISNETLNAFIKDLEQAMLTQNEHGYCEMASIHIDYGPWGSIAELATKHGIHYSHFPVKTTMFVNEDYVSVRKGYGSPNVFHYLLENGKWLITTLSGKDIDKIKDHVVNGTELAWVVR